MSRRAPLTPPPTDTSPRPLHPGCILAATYCGQTTLKVDDARKLDKQETADLVRNKGFPPCFAAIFVDAFWWHRLPRTASPLRNTDARLKLVHV